MDAEVTRCRASTDGNEIIYRTKENDQMDTFPGGAQAVISACYADDGGSRGADVTAKVKELLNAGEPLCANSENFGDPVPGVPKFLFVVTSNEEAFAPEGKKLLRARGNSGMTEIVEVPDPDATMIAHYGEIPTYEIPNGPDSVVRAFYGDDSRSRGADVTDKVKELLAAGEPIRPTTANFGDPAPGIVKFLYVDMREEIPVDGADDKRRTLTT